MKHVLTLSAGLVAIMWATNAPAENLKGDYGFTGNGACLIAALGTGFNANQTPSGDSFGASESAEGIRTFNGDGTGTINGSSMTVTIPAANRSASSDDFKYNFTYTVNSDGSWTSDLVAGSYTGTVTSGPRNGQTFAITNLPTISGLIKNNKSVLTGATLTPTVETITFSNGDTFQRFCHRSRVYIELKQ
jgi:hypothetical protein